jgi:hypothetical protein
MSTLTKIGKLNTTINVDSQGITRVTLYKTQIVSFSDEVIILNHGGWQTSTTKNRMNQVSFVYGLGYSVFQKKGGEWFVKYKGKVIKWDNNLALVIGRKVLACPNCDGEHIQRAEGHKLNKCLSCHFAFD